ncbi:hypothetical protein V6L77_23360 [Pannonibacter sp. Pt2-lr]
MIEPLGIAGDLGADDTGRVGIVRRPAQAANTASAVTSTSSAQVEGQSCGQAEWAVMVTGLFIFGLFGVPVAPPQSGIPLKAE